MGAEELVIIDADGQHNPAEIPDLLTELRQGNDVVIPDSTARSVPAAYARRAIEAIRLDGNGVDAGTEIMAQVRGMKVAAAAGARPGKEPLYRGKRIAVVVPAYNEEELIGETLSGIPDYVARIYAVDDGSSDRTGEIIEDYARRDSRIVPIHHNPNRGVGAAITSGYKRALEDGMDIVAVMAGDTDGPGLPPRFLTRSSMAGQTTRRATAS